MKNLPKIRLNGFTLKMIACAAMLINHLGLILFNEIAPVLRVSVVVGRISFPIFAFLLVEGFFHSSNLKIYMIRLGIFAILSEFAFDYALLGVKSENVFAYQNVMFTMFLGLITITLYDRIQTKYRSNAFMANSLCVFLLIGSTFIANVIKSDYFYYGILMIVIMYLFHNNKRWLMIATVLLVGFFGSGLEIFQLLALPFILFYSGEEGKKSQKFFYIFYPAHFLIIGLIHQFLIK